MSIPKYPPAIIAQTTIQMITSALSAICSTTLAIMILRSNNSNNGTGSGSGGGGRLNTPYKRYLLGMCIADICQSLSLLTGPFMVPKEMNYVVGLASGNMITCNINGFFFTFGVACNLFYLFALMLSYLSKIKYNMPNQTFLKKYDKTIHAVALGYTCFCCTFLVASKSINSADRAGFCYILQSPMGCGSDCRGYEYRIYAFLLFYLFDCLLIVGVMVCMLMIVHHVIVTDQQTPLGTEAANNTEIPDSNSRDNEITLFQRIRNKLLSLVTEPCKFLAYLRSNEDSIASDDTFDDPSSHAVRARLARRNRKLATTTALLYTGSMLLVYSIPFLVSTLQLLVLEGRKAPTALLLIQFFLFPLGGVMFIFVHTWQKISILRKRNRRYSWIRAFIAIIMAGGELPPSVDDDNDPNEDFFSILWTDATSSRKWYDVIGWIRDRISKAKVQRRYKKKSGYPIRRRASELSDRVGSSAPGGLYQHHYDSGNLRGDVSSLSRSEMNTNISLEQIEEMAEQQQQEEEQENEFAVLSRMRLQMFMMNDQHHDHAAVGASSISTSTASRFEMTTADIHKKYSVDMFSRESDTSE